MGRCAFCRVSWLRNSWSKGRKLARAVRAVCHQSAYKTQKRNSQLIETFATTGPVFRNRKGPVSRVSDQQKNDKRLRAQPDPILLKDPSCAEPGHAKGVVRQKRHSEARDLQRHGGRNRRAVAGRWQGCQRRTSTDAARVTRARRPDSAASRVTWPQFIGAVSPTAF